MSKNSESLLPLLCVGSVPLALTGTAVLLSGGLGASGRSPFFPLRPGCRIVVLPAPVISQVPFSFAVPDAVVDVILNDYGGPIGGGNNGDMAGVAPNPICESVFEESAILSPGVPWEYLPQTSGATAASLRLSGKLITPGMCPERVVEAVAVRGGRRDGPRLACFCNSAIGVPRSWLLPPGGCARVLAFPAHRAPLPMPPSDCVL